MFSENRFKRSCFHTFMLLISGSSRHSTHTRREIALSFKRYCRGIKCDYRRSLDLQSDLFGALTHILLLSIYGCTSFVDPGRFFSFLIYTQLLGLLGRGISRSQDGYLHTEEHKHRINAHRCPCLEWDSNPRSQCSSRRRRFTS
jgi:hypothetical protein